jgi:2-dehydropantoate 2-reductase
MNDIQQVIVVGLGAIGSIWAVKLHDYDPACVRVLVDEARLERYTDQGIIFNGQRRDFTYIVPGPGQPAADLILIATKADGLGAAIDAIEGFVHPETQILALLNGVTSEQSIAARYGWERVLYAFIVGHGSTRIGNAITFDGVGRIVFGEADNRVVSERVAAVKRFFDPARIDYEVPDDMLFALWRKFVLNVGINQASAVLRADYGAFQRSEKARAIALALMGEALAVAQLEGVNHIADILPWCLAFIENAPPAFKSSMLQDIEAGNKTEVAIMGETICALGLKHGLETPHNAAFVGYIKALEEIGATRRDASR